jgi:diguanylate cyclase (GGDEF)-like protein
MSADDPSSMARGWNLQINGKRGFFRNLLSVLSRLARRDSGQSRLSPGMVERYVLGVQAANDGLIDWNLKTDKVTLSRRAQELLGVSARGRSQDWLSCVHSHDRAGFEAALYHHLDGNSPRFEYQHRVQGEPAAHLVQIRGAVIDEPGHGRRFIALVNDVKVQRHGELQLQGASLYDPLTGLASRALFIDRLNQLLNRSLRQTDLHFAVMLLDLDDFARIHQNLGPVVSNRLLKAVAVRLEQSLRLMDPIARLEGGRLAILIGDDVGLDDALMVAERLQEQVARGFKVNGGQLLVTASIGIGLGGSQEGSPTEVLRWAGIALEQAKHTGRCQCRVFNPGATSSH